MCESAYACACVFGVGVTLHAWNGGCRGRDDARRGEEVVCSGVQADTVQSGGEWISKGGRG